ncbi:sodium/metabolite cotransporter BASS6 chloroplastic isoform X1 [Tripterygium wilfordii]|uniref:Sodium/metabolite cotransporter BASS6 chloroplastic isoform X1 n=1 Tax=Tripterygium wilfordii TaxID=458696 RepID=A0A7J7CK67_TRIWF|nr:probable sodium/metabolite cotransporter BASS5, chloroplastic [Tripterygium wilfordii]KAF5734448.1 sodium/metabolite cotransporter BASS6 chloroplastic isoform X1 [Tripterygium wilfordii]
MKANATQSQIQRPHISSLCAPQIRNPVLPRNIPFSYSSSEFRSIGLPVRLLSQSQIWNSRFLVSHRRVSEKLSDSFEPDSGPEHVPEPDKVLINRKSSLADILKQANSLLPHVVIASTLLALVYPPSFSWFTSRYYAPALGFLMFAVGVNSSEKDFIEAFKRPAAIFAGYVGQFVLKPILGYLFGTISITLFGLPNAVGAGIMLVSCVSGAQLSNYATFLTDPPMAPLSIVMTSLSTASAVFVTPLLSLLLIGKRLPVDVKGMVSSILQIVVAPIVTGLLLNRFFPRICDSIKSFLPPLSVIVTALCVGAPLAINVDSVMSPFGITILSLIIAFHLVAFVASYFLAGFFLHKAPDVKALQRTISYETGMQSSLLALALANRFFQDPLVAVPPAISTVIMSLMGFSLVMIWAKRKQ